MTPPPVTPSEDPNDHSSTIPATRSDRSDRHIQLIHSDFFNDFGDLFDENVFRETPVDIPMVVTPE